MSRKPLPPMSYPLPHSDSRKTVEVLLDPFLQGDDSITEVGPFPCTDKGALALRQRFHRYRRDWYDAADLDPSLAGFAQLMRRLTLSHDKTTNTVTFKMRSPIYG